MPNAIRRSTALWCGTALSALIALLGGLLPSAAQSTTNPIPLINEPLAPNAAAPGGPGFTLTVNGTGFVSGAIVNWNGRPRATNFVTNSQLTASILASDIVAASAASITVTNPGPGGGTSNVQFFSVTNPAAAVNLARLDSGNFGATGRVLIAGDFNGDEKLDLADIGQGDGETLDLPNACVKLGNGDGTFQAPRCSIGPQSGPYILIAADFNGDGLLDLAATDDGPKSVSVMLGNGDGTFQIPKVFTVSMPKLFALAAADFNDDGKLDVVVGSWDPAQPLITVLVYLRNGDGTFSTHVDTTFAGSPGGMDLNGNSHVGVAIGDFNRDGKLDVAIVDNTGSIFAFLGNGDGSFQSPHSVAAGAANLRSTITTADVNGDGNLDLILLTSQNNAGSSARASVFLGNGDGTFQPSIDSPSGDGPLSLAIGDLNGDGKLDLAVLEGNNSLGPSFSILLGNGNGTFQSPAPYSGGSIPVSFTLGDFNGDGTTDLAVRTQVGPTCAPNDCGLSMFLQGTFPVLGVSPNDYLFQPQAPGTTSPPQGFVLTNTGTATVTISSITLTGPNAGNFAESNTCGSSLPAGATCGTSVTFTPTTDAHPDPSGYFHAEVTINNNGLGNPLIAQLAGSAQDFSLSPFGGDNGTVMPGQTATYSISVNPLYGFNQSIALSCSGAPPQSTCSVSPASVTLDGSHFASATVTVTTTAPSHGVVLPFGTDPPCKLNYPPTPLVLELLGIAMIVSLFPWRRDQRLRWAPVCTLMLLLCLGLTMASCGGGGGSGGGGSVGTQAGTYTITVSGNFTSGSTTLTHATKVTLVVQ
jgi:hypothetical protein